MSGPPSAETKASLRRDALTRRDALSRETRAAATMAVAGATFPVAVGVGQCVAGYAPIRGEIDPTPLMSRLAAGGARLALPVVTAKGHPLTFRAWVPDDVLVAGPFGILEPTEAAAPADPDILLVPLAAFDRAGHRIGYGAGYYDRTIAQWRARKAVAVIGLAFAVQEVPAVPALAHDAKLDLVLTEAGIIDLRGG